MASKRILFKSGLINHCTQNPKPKINPANHLYAIQCTVVGSVPAVHCQPPVRNPVIRNSGKLDANGCPCQLKLVSCQKPVPNLPRSWHTNPLYQIQKTVHIVCTVVNFVFGDKKILPHIITSLALALTIHNKQQSRRFVD